MNSVREPSEIVLIQSGKVAGLLDGLVFEWVGTGIR